MSLQNRETGEYAPPREQVNLPQQQLQEKTPAEIVTEYVRQDIAVTKKMRESVDKLMMSNELLRQSLGNELGKFSEQMCGIYGKYPSNLERNFYAVRDQEMSYSKGSCLR